MNKKCFFEAMEILLKNLTPSQIARLLASWQKGDSDYLKVKRLKLFMHK
jgi:hypothetical protein